MSYQLIDTGNQRRLEKWGNYSVVRPASQAIWDPLLPEQAWNSADAFFTRDPSPLWSPSLPSHWVVKYASLYFKIAPTSFGHMGLFPEHATIWESIRNELRENDRFLNLFAYTGGASCTAAKLGAQVTHLDASAAAVRWARENAALNQLTIAPIRWIVEDVIRFLEREFRRGARYEAILLDPPSFGRGNRGELFKIEKDLPQLIRLCSKLLSPDPRFLLLSSHTAGHSPTVLRHLLQQQLPQGSLESAELLIPAPLPLPSGSYALWRAK